MALPKPPKIGIGAVGPNVPKPILPSTSGAGQKAWWQQIAQHNQNVPTNTPEGQKLWYQQIYKANAAKAPSAPSAPPVQGPGVFTAGAPSAQNPVPGPGPDVRDSQYWANTNLNQANVNTQVNDIDRTDANASTNLQEALRRLAERHPIDMHNATDQANAQGLIASGHLGRQLGDLETQYRQGVNDQNTANDQAHAARSAAREALLSGVPLYEAAQLAAAADRQSQRDTNNPALGVPNPTTAADIGKPTAEQIAAYIAAGTKKPTGQGNTIESHPLASQFPGFPAVKPAANRVNPRPVGRGFLPLDHIDLGKLPRRRGR